MENCLTCGMLIPPLNMAMGYAGPTCQCTAPQRVQRRVSDLQFPNNLYKEDSYLEFELSRLREENARLRSVLEFYADRRSWADFAIRVLEDNGETARTALKGDS